jgi:CBS domain-containing protein
LIVENSKIVGVFSERDALLRLDVELNDELTRPVSDFMTPSPQKITADSKIAFAVRMMDLGSYRHVPVVDDEDRPVGVISVRDILGYLTEKMTSGASAP